MNFSRRHFIGAVAAGSHGLLAPRAFAAARSDDRPTLLPRAMAALDRHAVRIPRRDVVGLADFSQPSGVARFHVVDVAGGKILTSRLVAHGRGSDPLNSGWVQRFSNLPGSNASSHGSFLTGSTYYGKHGLSRRLNGLDAENSNAASRAIVIHGADYVDPGMAMLQGRVGRSLGCFAFAQRDIADMLRLLGEGRLLLAWK